MDPGPDGLVVVGPAGPRSGAGVLVLAGSSGITDVARARVLAGTGAVVVALRWFGGPRQSPGICEVPLETFTAALDLLSQNADRLVVLGTSKGAEAALLVAAHDARVDAVAAFAPPHVVWANVGAGTDGRDRPLRSSWTLGGRPLPFVPYTDHWEPDGDPPAFRGLYEASLARYPGQAERAALPVERIAGDVLLAAGGDDQVWPADESVRLLAARRSAHGQPTTVVVDDEAGHRLLLPGETPSTAGATMRRGGTPEADARLGRSVWDALLPLLAG